MVKQIYYCVCRGRTVPVAYHECTACQIAMPLNDRRKDEKTVAERQWRAPLRPSTTQKSCDIGLFSDEASQLDLIDMFMEPS